MKAFEKFENAVFFKIFKIPSDRQLILVSNLTKIFFGKKFQQLWLLELSKIWGEMGLKIKIGGSTKVVTNTYLYCLTTYN